MSWREDWLEIAEVRSSTILSGPCTPRINTTSVFPCFRLPNFISHRHMCGIWPIATASIFFLTNHIYFVGLDSGAIKHSIMCACICTRDLATYIAYRPQSGHFQAPSTFLIWICTLKALHKQGYYCRSDQFQLHQSDIAVSSSVKQELPTVRKWKARQAISGVNIDPLPSNVHGAKARGNGNGYSKDLIPKPQDDFFGLVETIGVAW